MYISSFCKLMRINIFLFSQHGIRAIKEFENTRVRVSPCGQFRQPIKRPCHNPVVLQSSRSLTEAKPSSKYLAAGNFYRRDFSATSIPTEEHTNRSASLRSTFKWKPRRKITSHALTRADLQVGACNTVFTRASSRRCVCRRQANPSTPRTSPLPKKPFFFQFFSPTTITLFLCCLNLHCFCVFWSSTMFSGPWELYLLIPTDFSSLWLKKTSLWLKKVRLLILLYLELL